VGGILDTVPEASLPSPTACSISAMFLAMTASSPVVLPYLVLDALELAKKRLQVGRLWLGWIAFAHVELVTELVEHRSTTRS
jgi:hypothetical protein